MKKTTKEYEEMIRNSKLFDLDPNTEKTAYQRESLKLIGDIYNYVRTWNDGKYEDYGLEITNTAKTCIKNYSKEKGDFLHYFNAAMKKVYRRSHAEREAKERGYGVHIPEKDYRIIRKVIKLLEAKGIFKFQDDDLKEIASVIGINEDKVKKYMKDYQKTKDIIGFYINVDGDETYIFDNMIGEDDVKNRFNDIENIKEILEKIDSFFSSRRRDQRSILSYLLTMKMVPILSEYSEIINYANSLSFWNASVWNDFQNDKMAKTAKEVAIMFGVSEQSISRTYRNFVSSLRSRDIS